MRRCELLGLGTSIGGQASFSNRKSSRPFRPNLHWKRLKSDKQGRLLRLRLSSRALKLVAKRGGLDQAVLAAEPALLSPRLRRFRKYLLAVSEG